MNIIYKNTDFSIPIHVVDNEGLIPIEDLEVLNIKVFTTDISTCITFDKTDLDASGNLHIDASTLADCQNGLVYYKYQAAYPDTAWQDGVYDVARIVQTDNYFKYHDNAPVHKTTCATAVSELVNDVHYATEDWVTEQITGGIDLTDYYNKDQVDALIEAIDVPDDYLTPDDVSTFVTESEVQSMIPDTSEFITAVDISTCVLSQVARYIWTGDASTYDAMESHDASTIYLIKED